MPVTIQISTLCSNKRPQTLLLFFPFSCATRGVTHCEMPIPVTIKIPRMLLPKAHAAKGMVPN